MNTALEASLIAIRRIVRLNKSDTKALAKKVDLAASDVLILQTLADTPNISPGELALMLGLSPVTATVILQKLENRLLIQKVRNVKDKRRLEVQLTAKGEAELQGSPSQAHSQFVAEFEHLPAWEQLQIAAVLTKIALLISPPAQ
jgi:MarR family transcriptional regulator, organic hydroperoxide resistance regulator